jgi:DNA-binding NtrC family response regulator
MSLRMQALLLRFLETGEIQRVGSDRRLPSLDVRVIAATHRRLITHIAEKTFREDLYYRLNDIHIEVPPLRERREDIVVLLRYFLQMFSETHELPVPELTADAMTELAHYPWPGNVRELRNVAERLVLRSAGRPVEVEQLPQEILQSGPRQTAAEASARQTGVKPTHFVLFERMLRHGASFWSEAYEPFMARDLTRHEIRELVRLGLEHTRGNYKLLVTTFNMPPEDYKKFLNFLRKYQCHVPFQRFRMMPAPLQGRSSQAMGA